MGLRSDVTKMENELFNTLTIAFYCLQMKEGKKLRFCMTALEELEKEYVKITKTKFVTDDNYKRLNAGLKAMSGSVRRVPPTK